MTRRRFKLRTLFVMVALLACAAEWVAYQLDWLRQRHAIIPAGTPLVSGPTLMKDVEIGVSWDRALPPWPLPLFGEQGYIELYAKFPESSPEVAHLHELFPEAHIICVDPAE